MRCNALVFVALACAAPICVHAQDLASTCHASSSYDLTIVPEAVLFDRAGPAPRRVKLHAGRLEVDGAAVRLNTEDRDRLTLFEEQLRALAPKARGVANDGVDLAISAVRAETANLGLSTDTLAQLDGKLAEQAAGLKRRIAMSTSTHDWGDAFDRYSDVVAADIAPLLASDLARQAMAAVVNGDLDAAATLQSRAADLTGDLQPRLERRMQALRPQIQALCPSIKRLYQLQRDIRGPNARPLDLLDIDAH